MSTERPTRTIGGLGIAVFVPGADCAMLFICRYAANLLRCEYVATVDLPPSQSPEPEATK